MIPNKLSDLVRNACAPESEPDFLGIRWHGPVLPGVRYLPGECARRQHLLSGRRADPAVQNDPVLRAHLSKPA
jgi:hypothetical protein